MRSNLEWKKWGEVDPLYAVATAKGKERNSPDAWTDEEFYEFGRSEWEVLKSQWQQYGLQPGHCVELGCGAGRITRQLADNFVKVSALDVSEGQIDYAREHVRSNNVHFYLTDGISIPLPPAVADAAFSIYVFQHFDSLSDASNVLRELRRVLRPGGTLMIQLPLYEFPDSRLVPLFRGIASTFKFLSDAKAAANRQLIKRGIWRPMMRRLRFEGAVLAEEMGRLGFTGVEFRAFRGVPSGLYYTFVFATATT